MAHAYTSKAIARVVKLGVRTIEHGNLIDEDTAGVMTAGMERTPCRRSSPTMRWARVGAEMGIAQSALEKNETVRYQGLKALEMLQKRGVKMGLGTDLLGDMHQYQSDELSIRANIIGAFETIRQATAIGAEIVSMKGKLGVIAASAFADLLVVDGDPLKDIAVLTGQGERIAGVMKNGAWVRQTLL